MKRLAVGVATALATLLVVYLLWQFRSAVWLFLLSLAIAAAARPFVSYWEGKGMSQTVVLVAVYGMGLLGLGLLLYLVGLMSFEELGRAVNQFVVTYDRLWNEWPHGGQFQQLLVQWLPPPNELYGNIAGERLAALLGGLLGITLDALDFISQALVVVMLSLYWSMDRVRFERLWLSLLAAPQRARARDLWREIEAAVGAYVRSELAVSLLAGFLLGVGYWMLGLEFPTLLTLSGVGLRFIPWLGVFLAPLLVLLVSWPLGPGPAALAAIYTLVILSLLTGLVEPRLVRRRYSALLMVMMMIALADLVGLVGVIFAPPLTAAVQVFFNHLTRSTRSANSAEIVRQVDELEERLRAVQPLLENAEDPPAPQAAHLTQRLAQLLTRARQVLQLNGSAEAG